MCCGCAKKDHHHDQQYILSASFLKKLSAYYTQAQVDALIPDLTPYYTQAQVDALIPDLTPYYTQAQVDALIPDLTPYYTKAQVDGLLDIPAFSAYKSIVFDLIGDGTWRLLPVETTLLDVGGDYISPAFLTPRPGIYTFDISILATSPTSTDLYVQLLTPNAAHVRYSPGAISHSISISITTVMDMGDTAMIYMLSYAGGAAITVYSGTYTSFSGHLVRGL